MGMSLLISEPDVPVKNLIVADYAVCLSNRRGHGLREAVRGETHVRQPNDMS